MTTGLRLGHSVRVEGSMRSLDEDDDAGNRFGDTNAAGPRPSTIPHVQALDGARGLAVAGVLLFHGGHLLGGYLGVDFFFTLSGFLITSLLLAESTRAGRVALGAFWARRARRLLPALAVLMVGVALYSRFYAAPEQLGQLRGDSFATLGYVANWHQIFSHQDYFAFFAGPSLLNHTWSLAIEEQFYVIWPLLFVALCVACKRATAHAVLVTSLLLACASSVLMIVLYHPGDVSRAYFGTDTRAAAILSGAALAAWLSIHGSTRSRARRIALEVLGVVGAAGLAIAWTRLDGQSSTLYRGGFMLCGLAATAVIAAAVHPQQGPVSWMLGFRPLCALGLISYGVYLYHWPLDVFLDERRVGFGGWPLFAFRTAVTLAVATASYRIIEQPIRRGALSSRQWRVLIPAVAVTLAVALVVVTGTSTGANSDFNLATLNVPISIPPVAAPAVAAPAISVPSASPVKATPAANVVPHAPERVMVVGNSVASLLGRSMAAIDTQPHITVLDAGLLACTFPPEVEVPRLTMPNGMNLMGIPCDPPSESRLVNFFRPDVVFWVVSNPSGKGGKYRGQAVEPCSPVWDSLYSDDLRKVIGTLGATGARVVITTAAYSRFYGLPYNDRAMDCDNQTRRAVAAETGAQLVDLFWYTCPEGRCRERQDGVVLRPDGLHYAGPGGEIVARWLLEQIR